MARATLVVFALLFAYSAAQMMPVPGFINVPRTAFHPGGRVNFGGGLSLGQVCKQIVMFGGKEALSDGMGAAAKWFHQKKINTNTAGGNDPQMQCLYAQATGGMPGMVGAKDPGNMFGDYFDTVIEYPMVLDPCTAPQCNGQVNPTVLLMQAFAPMMRRGLGGMQSPMNYPMGNMGGAMTNPMGGAMANPMASLMGLTGQSPLLSALMPKAASPTRGTSMTSTGTQPATAVASKPAAVPAAVPSPTQKSVGQMMNMFGNPQMMQQLFKQFLMTQVMSNAAKPSPVAQAQPSPASTGGFPAFPGAMSGMPNIFF